MQASIIKQTAAVKDQEKDMWATRFKTAQKTLDKLKEEIAHSGQYELLNTYLQKKDLELENAKYTTKIMHGHKVNYIYEQEAENWKSATVLGSEIIQECYLLLRGFDNLDSEMEKKMKGLLKLYQIQRSVKFEDKTTTDSKEQLENILNLSDFEGEITVNDQAVKRRIKSDEMVVQQKRPKPEQDFQFSKPATVKAFNFDIPALPTTHVNMNETKIISTASYNEVNRVSDDEAMDTDDMNATYCMPPKSLSTKTNPKGPCKTITDANQNVAKLMNGVTGQFKLYFQVIKCYELNLNFSVQTN